MAVRAKFRVTSVRPVQHTNHKTGEVIQTQEVWEMQPVYSADPADENHTFWKATPSGSLTLNIDNPEAWGTWEQGQEVYLDLTPAADAMPA